MARFTPPMYRKVRKKVPPRPTRPVAAPVVSEKAAEPEAPKKVESTAKAVTKTPTPQTTKKVVSKKTVKKLKAIKWDDGMTQKDLYKKAKTAGLNVKSKDWKSEIIAEIQKYNKKIAK